MYIVPPMAIVNLAPITAITEGAIQLHTELTAYTMDCPVKPSPSKFSTKPLEFSFLALSMMTVYCALRVMKMTKALKSA